MAVSTENLKYILCESITLGTKGKVDTVFFILTPIKYNPTVFFYIRNESRILAKKKSAKMFATQLVAHGDYVKRSNSGAKKW